MNKMLKIPLALAAIFTLFSLPCSSFASDGSNNAPYRHASNTYIDEDHQIHNISGMYITLENGTVWLMEETDAFEVESWVRGDHIQVRPANDAEKTFPYEFIFYKNTKWGEEVRVRIVEIPYYTTYVVGFDINKFQCRVFLSDGSCWKIDEQDKDIILGTYNNRKWLANDFVMVGSNQGEYAKMNYAFPQVLINLSTGDYVHARPF